MDRAEPVLEFKPRDNNLSVTYQQPFTNVVREKLEQKQNQQSILELGLSFFHPVWENLHPSSCS